MAKRCRPKSNMGERRVKLETLDRLIHYSLALYLGLPIVIFAGYFVLGQLGLFGLDPTIDGMIVTIPGIILGPLCLIAYLIQREKLKFELIRATVDQGAFTALVKEISAELRWTIRSRKDNTYTIKTNPGFVNQSWGQHITLQLVKGGILMNSIFDPNKGSWIITFGSNTENINDIKKRIITKTQLMGSATPSGDLASGNIMATTLQIITVFTVPLLFGCGSHSNVTTSRRVEDLAKTAMLVDTPRSFVKNYDTLRQ
jgi:hypothetical protein